MRLIYASVCHFLGEVVAAVCGIFITHPGQRDLLNAYNVGIKFQYNRSNSINTHISVSGRLGVQPRLYSEIYVLRQRSTAIRLPCVVHGMTEIYGQERATCHTSDGTDLGPS